MHHPLHRGPHFIGPKRCLEPHSCMHFARPLSPSHSRDYSNHLSPGWACALYGMIGTLRVFSKHWHDLSDAVSQAITEPDQGLGVLKTIKPSKKFHFCIHFLVKFDLICIKPVACDILSSLSLKVPYYVHFSDLYFSSGAPLRS